MPTSPRTSDAAALAAWTAHLRAERHVSPHTLRAYTGDVRHFLAVVGPIRAVTPATVRHWLRTLDRAAERTSIVRRLAAVRSLFRFLVRSKRLGVDPTAGLATPKTRRTLPAHLTLDEVDRLLSTPAVDRTLGLRDRALFEVMYSSGLRVSELVGLDWNDVDRDTGVVRVLGKGHKERVRRCAHSTTMPPRSRPPVAQWVARGVARWVVARCF
jgi:integrase/recombinase XerC